MSVGEACPALRGLTFVKGEPVPIGVKDPNVNKVLVLEFWATWCPPCRQTIPHLTELQHKYKDKHVYLVGITSETDMQKVDKFIKDMGDKMDYYVAVDTSQHAQEELYMKSQAGGIPYAFIVNHDNKITYAGHPMEPAFASALQAAAQHASDKKPKVQLLPITESYDELMKHSAKELKAMLVDRGIDAGDCFEKSDLANKVVERCSKVTYYK